MAGERKGKTYEAIVFVVLQQLKKKGKFKGEVFWNKTPKGMTIEPDLVIGKDIDHPSHIFLITHSGSAKESEKKLWRNMGELAEAKTFVATIPHVFNIAFDAVIKEDLKKIQAAAFDGQLIVGDTKYGSEIQAWVDKNQADLPTKGEDKAKEITARLSKDREVKRLIGLLSKDIVSLLSKRRPELEQLWKMERKRKPGKAPTAKTTFVRRGLSKLLIFEDTELALRLYRRKRIKLDEVPQYAYELGLAKKSIGRASPGDPEIQNAVDLLTDDQIRGIVAKAPLDRMESWLLTLRNTPHLEFMGEYVIREYDKLCDPKELARRLKNLHKDPWALVDKKKAPQNWPPGTVWLFEYILEVIKASTKTASGYGYAQLEREASLYPGMPVEGDPVYRINLPDWVHRRGKMALDSKVVEGVSEALSNRLQAISLNDLEKIIKPIKISIAKNITETKLLTYRMFDPLRYLILEAVPFAKKIAIRTCFGEAANLKGQAGKTSIMMARHYLINWQSVSDAGRDHKKKELCGRAVGLRYTWESKNKSFIKRPGINKLLLVLDGTWRQGDLDALCRAGWDEIFYPDEMDKLAKAIV